MFIMKLCLQSDATTEGPACCGVRDIQQDVWSQSRQPGEPGPQLRPHQGPAEHPGQQSGQCAQHLGLQGSGCHVSEGHVAVSGVRGPGGLPPPGLLSLVTVRESET